jgi:hypothetical protein
MISKIEIFTVSYVGQTPNGFKTNITGYVPFGTDNGLKIPKTESVMPRPRQTPPIKAALIRNAGSNLQAPRSGPIFGFGKLLIFIILIILLK